MKKQLEVNDNLYYLLNYLELLDSLNFPEEIRFDLNKLILKINDILFSKYKHQGDVAAIKLYLEYEYEEQK